MLNEIFPSYDGNFTVLGQYPHRINLSVREQILKNVNFYIYMVKVGTVFALYRFTTKSQALKFMHEDTEFESCNKWLVWPVQK